MPTDHPRVFGYLIIEGANESARKFALTQRETTIGRFFPADILLDNPSVQRDHASIRWSKGDPNTSRPWLFNQSVHGRTNYERGGTTFSLQGEEAKDTLTNGCRIFVGDYVLTFYFEEAQADAYLARLQPPTDTPLSAPPPPLRPSLPLIRPNSGNDELPDKPRELFDPFDLIDPVTKRFRPELWTPKPSDEQPKSSPEKSEPRKDRPDLRQHKYINYLPAIFQMDAAELMGLAESGNGGPDILGTAPQSLSERQERAPFLWRFLQIMEALWEPREHRQDFIEYYFDPRTCPATFLPWLADWFGIWLPPQSPEDLRRRLLARAMYFHRWRGTPLGLKHLLNTCTLLETQIEADPKVPFCFTVTIKRPADKAIEFPNDLLNQLIQHNKPAACTYILNILTIDPSTPKDRSKDDV